MRPVADVVASLGSPGLGFERVKSIPGTTYQDSPTVILIPTRGMIHHRVVSAWLGLMPPMNTARVILFATGHEVGQAYNALLANVLADPQLSKWPYVLTLEDDNLPPPDAHLRLLESIQWGKFDAVSGLYFTKGEWNMPMAYGDPAEWQQKGVFDFRPRDTREAISKGQIMPVNGIAMGCALWRMELFRQIPPPWFVTCNDVVDGAVKCFTQDLFFCERASRAGKRFAVDCRVHVGHLDINTGLVY